MKRCPFCAEEIQDAAIVCRHCNRELTGSPVPAAGVIDAPQKQMKRRRWPWIVGGLFVLGTIGQLLDRTSTDRKKLAVSVEASGLNVTVKNEDHQDWNNVRVMINNKFFCPPTSVEQGKSVTISLIQCATGGGERYQPLSMAVSYVTVEAVLTEDTGEAIAGFKTR